MCQVLVELEEPDGGPDERHLLHPLSPPPPLPLHLHLRHTRDAGNFPRAEAIEYQTIYCNALHTLALNFTVLYLI